MDLMMAVYPELRLRQEFYRQISEHDGVYCKKSNFIDAFHHSVPHVPRIAASYQAFLFDLGGMLMYKDLRDGSYWNIDSTEGKAIYHQYRMRADLVEKGFEKDMKMVGGCGNREKFKALDEYIR